MTNKEALQKIKALFGFDADNQDLTDETSVVETVENADISTEETQVETSFETAQVEGAETVVGVEGDWETGKTLYIVTDEENMVAPEGSYVLNNGFTLLVDESGVITEITETNSEEVESAEATPTEVAQEEMSDDFDLTELVSVITEVKNIIDTKFNEVNQVIEEKNTKITELEERLSKFEKSPGGKKITNSYFENIKRDNNDQDFKFNKVKELAKKLNK